MCTRRWVAATSQKNLNRIKKFIPFRSNDPQKNLHFDSSQKKPKSLQKPKIIQLGKIHSSQTIPQSNPYFENPEKSETFS